MALARKEFESQLAGQYAIERELGRGGMASVWLARDLRLDRQVALKILHPELAGAIGVDRFAREVRTLARLTHPHIVSVIASGVVTVTDGSRLPWYTMPLIVGESLRERLAREPQLPVEFALRLTEQVAGALSAAHQLGIVHRDIKPENVLLTEGGAYVADFGIAKALVETGDERLTSTGLAIGTPAYMSPEQAAANEVDARTDQYSLACLLYEMLCGEPPFTGPTAQAIIARRMTEPARPIRTVRSAVPPQVEQAVLKALERVPADRFSSVSEFATALRVAHDVSPRSDVVRRRWSFVAAVGVLTVSLVGSWLLWSPRARGARRAADPDVVALYDRGRRGYARRTPEGAREAVAAYSAALQRDSSYAAAWNGLAQAYVQAYGRQFSLSGISGDALLRLAVAAADRAIAIDSGSSGAWLTRAIVSRVVDPTQMRRPIQWASRAVALDSGNARAWHTLASSLMDAGDGDRAIDTWRQSVRRDPAYAEGVAFLGLAHYWSRRFDSAAVWADSAVALDPSYLLGRTTAGFVAIERGAYAKAVAEFEAARRVTTDVEEVNALAGRALAEARGRATTRARATLRQADSMAAHYTPVSSHVAVYMAQAYAAVGETGRALAWIERHAPSDGLHFQLHLRCDPPLDPIRHEPRFRAVLRRPDLQQGSGC